MDDDDNDDKITICDEWVFGCNRCFICDTAYKHTTTTIECEGGLQEVQLRYIHPRCAKSAQRLKRLREKALDAEFEHFCLKFNKYFH